MFDETDCGEPFEDKDGNYNKPIKDCQVYKASNSCHKYELTTQGKVRSCQRIETCDDLKDEPECLQYHETTKKKNGAASFAIAGATFAFLIY